MEASAKLNVSAPVAIAPAERRRLALQGYFVAVIAALLAYLFRLCLDPVVGARYPYALSMLSIVLVAWRAGFGPSLLTFALGFVMSNWSFVPPRYSLGISDTLNLVGNLSYFSMAFTVIFSARSMHRARERAAANEREALAHKHRLEQEVAERKRAEEEVRRLNAELEQRVQQRTAELEAFTYSVSHDLRSPIRHVDGYAQILEKEFGAQLSPAALACAANIRKGSRQMGQLVDDLLNLSRVGKTELNLSPVPLGPLVEEIVADLRAETAGRDIAWRIGPLPTVRCDAGLAKQVFCNLLDNAVKYTRPREQATVEVDCVQLEGETVLRVRDNGVGFNMKYAQKLFGVFQRLHRAEDFEGTGVGLATVQRIVEKHGGRIWAEAGVNRGAAFCFTLAPSDRATS